MKTALTAFLLLAVLSSMLTGCAASSSKASAEASAAAAAKSAAQAQAIQMQMQAQSQTSNHQTGQASTPIIIICNQAAGGSPHGACIESGSIPGAGIESVIRTSQGR